MTVDQSPPGANQGVPLQLLDAGPATPGRTPDGDVAVRLRRGMLAARSADGPDETVLALVDLVDSLVDVDALTLELRGPVGEAVPWLLAHRGLSRPECELLSDPVWRARGPARLAHRWAVDLTGERARPGRLTLWRTRAAFDPGEIEHAQLAATVVETLLHQFLRRVKGRQRQRWAELHTQFDDDATVERRLTGGRLQLVVEQVAEVAACDLCWLVIGGSASPVLRAVTGLGLDLAALRGVDVGSTFTALVLDSGEQLRLPDLRRVYPAGADPRLEFLRSMGPVIVQPILVEGRVAGAVGLAWSAERASNYLTLDPTLPEAFAARAALAIRIARSQEHSERIGVLEERNRIRLDLHDRVVQRLYVLGMTLDAARRPGPSTSIEALVEHAVEEVDETIGEVRRTITNLSMTDEGMQLYDALVAMLERVTVAAAFRPDLRIHGLSEAATVGPDLVDDLILVAQEAVSNVVRYAEASCCRVAVTFDDTVVLTVEDNGTGIAPDAVGTGLRRMRERAAAHGGTLVATALETGTRVIWSVPRVSDVADVVPLR